LARALEKHKAESLRISLHAGNKRILGGNSSTDFNFLHSGFDPKTRNLGVAVQSRYFSVGTAVPWARAGVGAVATHSFVNVSYGPRGLNLLKKGLTVNEVVEKLTRKDKRPRLQTARHHRR
jgi:hypothetical protein